MNTEITDETVNESDLVLWSKPKPPRFHLRLAARLQRHPVPIQAFFRHSIVLTYALPQAILEPLLPPGLALDTYAGFGFVAIAMVLAQSLRPAFCPKWCGQDFFLSGYRVFARYQNRSGRTLRGLRILRSDTDRPLMVYFGNRLTHYNYRLAQVSVRDDDGLLTIQIQTPRADADLHIVADFAGASASLPTGSPFADFRAARRFAGPLPFTFDYEAQTRSIVLIEGVREHWHPELIRVDVLRCTFFQHPAFQGVQPLLANAFHVEDVPYRWKAGVVEPLNKGDV